MQQKARPCQASTNRKANPPMVRTTFRDELAEPLAAQATIFAKCWSEWQDLNLRLPRPERVVALRSLLAHLLANYALMRLKSSGRGSGAWTRLLIQASMIKPAAISASRRVPTTAVSFGRSLSGRYIATCHWPLAIPIRIA